MSEEQTTNSRANISDLTPGMALEGKVKHIELYGAFVDIGIGQDALLHISQLGQSKVRNVEDVVKVGDTITVYVLKIDKAAGRVAISLTPTPSVTWDDLQQGQQLEGTVARIEDFGVFVDIGAERLGMVHVSQLADGYVSKPADVVSVGDTVDVRILKINRRKRQIDLSMKKEVEIEQVVEEDAEELPTAMELAFRKARESSGPNPKANKKAKREKLLKQQEDIISRTLKNHASS